MKRIYIAGSYNGDNIINMLDNMRRGMRATTEVLLAGYSPWVPWFDYHFQLMLRDNERLTIEDYYRYSIAWLEVSDAVLILPNSENSKGTQMEIKKAEKLKIPIFHDLRQLIDSDLKGY